MQPLHRAYEMGYRDAERSRPRAPERTASIGEGESHTVAELAEMLVERARDHAEARDALGPVWLQGGLTLAEGIRAKTAFFEREIARLEGELAEARLSMEMCCEEPCGSCAGCHRASEVHEGDD